MVLLMIYVKDKIHGNVELYDLEKKIIDCAEFQRLRKIKQLALTNLVYPGATHTRFEHSIGTLHLTKLICEKTNIDEEHCKKIRIYSLLHDIGHGAFSHELEDITKKMFGSHEEVGTKKIINGEIADVISEQYKPRDIIKISKEVYGNIVSSPIGSDRMDYLMRDSYNTGVAYGVIDVDRIINKIFIDKKKKILGVERSGLEAVESLLIGRFMMFSTVYLHHTVRIASHMLKQAVKYAIEDKYIQPFDIIKLYDEQLLIKLSNKDNNKKSRELIENIQKRKLMKVAYSMEKNKIGKTKLNEIVDAIRNKFKGNFEYIIPKPFSKFEEIYIRGEDKKIKEIKTFSKLLPSLKTMEESRRTILFICNQKERNKLRKIIEKIYKKINKNK